MKTFQILYLGLHFTLLDISLQGSKFSVLHIIIFNNGNVINSQCIGDTLREYRLKTEGLLKTEGFLAILILGVQLGAFGIFSENSHFEMNN